MRLKESQIGELSPLDKADIEVDRLEKLLFLLEKDKYEIYLRMKDTNENVVFPFFKDKEMNAKLPACLKIFKKEMLYFEDDSDQVKLSNFALHTNKLTRYDIFLCKKNGKNLDKKFKMLDSQSLIIHIQNIVIHKLAPHLKRQIVKEKSKLLHLKKIREECTETMNFCNSLGVESLFKFGYKTTKSCLYKDFKTDFSDVKIMTHVIPFKKSKLEDDIKQHNEFKKVKIKKCMEMNKISDIGFSLSCLDSTTFLNKCYPSAVYEDLNIPFDIMYDLK